MKINTPIVKPPPLKHTIKEIRIVSEFLKIYKHIALLNNIPNGNYEPVLILPGFMANDSMTIVLRTFLKLLNYNVYGWDLGINLGYSDELKDRIEQRFLEIYEHNKQKIGIIGWSLGGIYAREIAKEYPSYVSQVITLGSPFNYPHKGTCVRWAYEFITRDKVSSICDDERIHRLLTPPPVKCTAIYSYNDGIAHQSACKNLDEFCDGDIVRNIPVNGSHIGLTLNHRVSKIIGELLSEKR